MEYDQAEEDAIAYSMSDLDGHCRSNIYQLSRRMVGEIPPYPPAHLITVARVVHVLAYRVFNEEKHPDAAQRWGAYSNEEFARRKYIEYVIAVVRLNDAIDAAAKNGTIKLNDRISGTVHSEWRLPERDTAAKLQAALEWEQDDRRAAEILLNWPIWYPHFDDSIVTEPKQLLAWIESENIALPGETLALLGALKEAKWVFRAYQGFPSVIHPLQPLVAPTEPPAIVSVAPRGDKAAESKPVKHKLRTNTLDVPIQKAIRAAESQVLAAVFLELKELALAGEKPFTGELDEDGFFYTADNGEVTKLTRKALGQRLKRLAEADR